MTKRNLLLVSLLLVVGLAATAPCLFAQAVFDISNNTNFYIRNEGDAEGVGTITLSTTSAGTLFTSSGWYITYNVPLAHTGTATTTPYTGNTYAVDGWCTGADAAALCSTLMLSFAASPSSLKYANQIVITYTAPTILTGAGAQLSISTRVQGQGLAYNTPINASVRAFYQTPGYALTISPAYPNNFEVAAVGPGPATTTTIEEGPEYVLTCIGVKKIKSTAYDNDFSLTIAENWADALTSYSDEFNLENNSAYTGLLFEAPLNGSDILIELAHIPPDVGIHARSPLPCDPATECIGGDLFIEDAVETDSTGTDGLGVADFLYVIDMTNVTVQEWAAFGFKLWSHGPLSPNQNYQITYQVSLVPTSIKDGVPYFTATEGPAVTVVEFKDCVTKLLFPYVNAWTGGGSFPFANFGTGIDFANTTWDPFALTDSGGNLIYPDQAVGSAVPQSGNCIVYFYPADTLTTPVFTTPNIAAGASYAFDVATSVPGFKGKTGYAIAICNFQNAYGFAEIYDNNQNGAFLGAPTATLGYMAYVLPDPAFYRRSPAGDGLGENAIAPININRWILKMLMLGKIPGGDRKGAIPR